jgi:hypothetical protein
MVTKIAAFALQAMLIAFAAHSVYTAGRDTLAYANAFWTNVQMAHGDVKLLNQASLNFVRMLFSIASAIGAALGLIKAVRRALPSERLGPTNPGNSRKSDSSPHDEGAAGTRAGPGAATLTDEVFASNRTYKASPKHGQDGRMVGGREVSKEPTNGQAPLCQRSCRIDLTSMWGESGNEDGVFGSSSRTKRAPDGRAQRAVGHRAGAGDRYPAADIVAVAARGG